MRDMKFLIVLASFAATCGSTVHAAEPLTFVAPDTIEVAAKLIRENLNLCYAGNSTYSIYGQTAYNSGTGKYEPINRVGSLTIKVSQWASPDGRQMKFNVVVQGNPRVQLVLDSDSNRRDIGRNDRYEINCG